MIKKDKSEKPNEIKMSELEKAMNETGEGLGAKNKEKSEQDVDEYYDFGSESGFLAQLSRIREFATLDRITGETVLDFCERCNGPMLGH